MPPENVPTRELNQDEIKALLGMLESYERSRWLGRMVFKIIVGIGALTGAVVTFKSHIMALLKG